jgi:hypothetical protein
MQRGPLVGGTLWLSAWLYTYKYSTLAWVCTAHTPTVDASASINGFLPI